MPHDPLNLPERQLDPPPGPREPTEAEIVECLENRLEGACTLDDLAAAVMVNPGHLFDGMHEFFTKWDEGNLIYDVRQLVYDAIAKHLMSKPDWPKEV